MLALGGGAVGRAAAGTGALGRVVTVGFSSTGGAGCSSTAASAVMLAGGGASGTRYTGRSGASTGFTRRGGGAGGAAGLAAGGEMAAGLAACGGAVTAGFGGMGGADTCFSAFSTSPGLEMCDKSILVLIPSSVRARVGRDAACASASERKCCRTFSASSTEIELEWVFFSVTPTSDRTSRTALLLTSSSLARSLIRILSIRLFFPP